MKLHSNEINKQSVPRGNRITLPVCLVSHSEEKTHIHYGSCLIRFRGNCCLPCSSVAQDTRHVETAECLQHLHLSVVRLLVSSCQFQFSDSISIHDTI